MDDISINLDPHVGVDVKGLGMAKIVTIKNPNYNVIKQLVNYLTDESCNDQISELYELIRDKSRDQLLSELFDDFIDIYKEEIVQDDRIVEEVTKMLTERE